MVGLMIRKQCPLTTRNLSQLLILNSLDQNFNQRPGHGLIGSQEFRQSKLTKKLTFVPEFIFQCMIVTGACSCEPDQPVGNAAEKLIWTVDCRSNSKMKPRALTILEMEIIRTRMKAKANGEVGALWSTLHSSRIHVPRSQIRLTRQSPYLMWILVPSDSIWFPT